MFNNFQQQMDRLLDSRRSKENGEPLEGLSPEKFGKSAYCQLTYTPSKLADNVLFREANNLKRVEEEGSRCREFETQNQLLSDQVGYLKKERDGITSSLNEVITMYKGIISDMQTKADARLKELQVKCNKQIQKLIEDKHTEARYLQSEKELLQERIQTLEKQLADTQQQLQDSKNAHSDSTRELQDLTEQVLSLKQGNIQEKQKFEKELTKRKAQADDLRKQMMLAEVHWKETLSTQILKKEKEKQALERSHKAELEKVEEMRKNQLLIKNQEMGEITRAFEKEGARLKEILSVKDRMIENLSLEGNREKSRILQLTQQYQAEIGHLTHEKNRLLHELDCLGRDNETLVHDRAVLGAELEKENTSLRELLLQSSGQLDRCKGQLLSLGRENGTLLSKLKQTEEEARTWRDSYYLNKTRAYS